MRRSCGSAGALVGRTFTGRHRELQLWLCCAGWHGITGSSRGGSAAENHEGLVTPGEIVRLASLKDTKRFQEHVRSLNVSVPCDDQLFVGQNSPVRNPLVRGDIKISNRIAVQPMEGWDGTADGNPTEATIRRWKRFGQSGAGLIWGGEAVAVS